VAWWLAYEELYGDMDKEYPIMSEHSKYYYDYDRNDPNRKGPTNDTITLGGIGTDSIGAAETVPLNFGGAGEDVVIFGGDSSDTISVHGAQDFNFGSAASADTITFSSSTLVGAAGSDSIDFSRGAGSFYPADHPSQQFWQEDGFSLTGNPGAMASDTIRLTDDAYPSIGSNLDDVYKHHFPAKPKPDLKGPSHHKYQEDKGIADLKDYVSSTYQGHYTNESSDVQTLDLIHSVGDAESFCRSNALKYLSRYDKKGSAKRDILKAMHYCLLLYYFSGQTNETPTRGYETF